MLSEYRSWVSKNGEYYKNKGQLGKNLYNLFREWVMGEKEYVPRVSFGEYSISSEVCDSGRENIVGCPGVENTRH